MAQTAAASEAAGQSTQKEDLHTWWEHSEHPAFAAYLCWNSTLSGEHGGKPYSIPHVERWPYSQASLQRRYEYGRDVPDWWKPQELPPPPLESNPEVRTNAELARIQVALCVDEGGRIWTVLRDTVTHTKSPGWLSKRDLPGLLAAYGIHYSKQHLGRILRRYEGLYWNTDHKQKRLYIRSPHSVTEKLTQMCFDQKRPELVLTNIPRGKDMYLPTSAVILPMGIARVRS